ncbi:discoidin domain-containing protein [uncultured Microbacterium sp.]|uniref:discoidin domain-containing protein n=1 Tax=Microbacterium algeriense TaxID=2615184 RepID=UPI002591E149|nr:discoidin domain-containing protein [uncultured Microbacterium sp.]
MVDLGASQMVCSLSYTPRQDNQNGRIKDYEVFVSDSPAAPGAGATPVLKGQAAAGTATQTLAFAHPVKGRYLTLRALSEQAGNRWTAVAELAVDVRPAPALDATVSAVGRCVAGKAYLAVTVRNGEDVPVKVEMTTDYGAKSFAAVRPGASAFHSFAVRAKTLPAGTAGARVTAVVDGHEVTADLRTPFEEMRCG